MPLSYPCERTQQVRQSPTRKNEGPLRCHTVKPERSAPPIECPGILICHPDAAGAASGSLPHRESRLR